MKNWKLINKNNGLELSMEDDRGFPITSVMLSKEPENAAIAKETAAMIAASPLMYQAIQTISGWSKCTCKTKHGDNDNCAVLIAEHVLNIIDRGEH